MSRAMTEGRPTRRSRGRSRSSAWRIHTLPRTAAAALLAGSVAAAASCGGAPDAAFDRGSLEQVEDLSESLANDLLVLSAAVRDGDRAATAAAFAESVDATPLPAEPPPREPLVKWIDGRTWQLPAGTERMPRERFLEAFRGLFDAFDEIEDARFKVKGATFDGADPVRGSAKIKFYAVGRNGAGEREWLKGTGGIEAKRGSGGSWAIDAFRIDTLAAKVSRQDLFTDVTAAAGVAALFPAFGTGPNEGFVSHGAATADVNLDGLLDIAATGVERNYLYVNAGDGTFRDESESSLVKFAPIGSGALFVDHDNDGDPDLFFAAVGGQVLLENRFVPDGELVFVDVSERAGVQSQAIGFSAVSADVNGDGFGDIYVCSYNRYGTVMPDSWHKAENGTPNLLFVNRGDGTFEEAASRWGVDDARWSYAAGFIDIDADGDQDLYVANDFGENALYRNDGERFVDVARDAGVVDPGFGMGVSFGDYDNDGDFDLHVTNMSSTAGNRILARLYPEEHELRKTLGKQAAGNSLYRNAGDGTFHDATAEAGGFGGGWAFGGGFIDFDNDGWEDVYTPNGFVSGKSMKDT